MESPEAQSMETDPQIDRSQNHGKRPLSSASIGCPSIAQPSAPVDYQQGDLVWARVHQYPWWPAIIAADPSDGTWSAMKLSQGGKAGYMPHYHVLFFGPIPDHNWVISRNLMAFTGKEDYDKYMEDLKKNATSKTKKEFLKSIAIKSQYQDAWNKALEEIEEAAKETDVDERLERCVTVYFEKAELKSRGALKTPKKSLDPEAAKRKRKTVSPKKESEMEVDEEPQPEPVKEEAVPIIPASSAPPKPTKKNRKKTALPPSINADEDLIAMAQLPVETLPENDPEYEPELAFHSFTQKYFRSVAYRYPTMAYCQLKTLLHSIWSKMTLDEKRKSLAPPAPPNEDIVPEKSSKGKQVQVKPKEVDVIDIDADKPPLPAPLPDELAEYKENLGNYQLEVYRLTNIWAVRNQPVCGVCEKPGAEVTPENTNVLSSPPPAPNMSLPDEELVPCTGQCCRQFHKKCLSKMYEFYHLPAFAPAANDAILCAECHPSGRRTCFSCQKQDLAHNTENGAAELSSEDKEMIMCSVKGCGHFYHQMCAKNIRLSRFENNSFICPQHACHTCAAAVEDPTSAESSRTGRMFRCVRCPVAYHVGDFCVAAGTHPLGLGPYIVCGDHLEPTASLAMLSSGTIEKKTASVMKPVSVTWCFTCGKSGPHVDDKQQKQEAEKAQPDGPQRPPEKPLICCATCPAAYHRRCLPAAQAALADQRFTCVDCIAGKRPLYGDIVWVKVGNYRWWPCEIYHPENLPTNIRKMKHGTGEFAVRFFGTGEFFWLGRGRCFHYQYGDTSGTSGNSGLARSYNQSVIEATTAFDEWTRFKERQLMTQRERANCKPVPFKYVKSNYPIGDVQIPRVDLSEVPKCDCNAESENPCGSDKECVNRMTQVECHPQVCNAGDQCCNQRFVKRLYAPAEPFRTASRGWGLRALAPIKRGQFVVEYVGDLIDDDEHRRRVDEAKKIGETNFYFLTLDRLRIIDAGPKGNLSRFMNHSCQPSCEAQRWLVNGDLRVGLFALRDISAGEELTFNYNCDESNGDAILLDKQTCRCGAPDCRGLIGASKPSEKVSAGKDNSKANKLKKKARQSAQLARIRDEHEDECFQCGEHGHLVLCDRNRCPKAYHVGCLGKDKPPSGKFTCPWHFCSECWKPAAQLCNFCPHSFCAEHATPDRIVERMSANDGPMWCCTGHPIADLNEALGFNAKGEKVES